MVFALVFLWIISPLTSARADDKIIVTATRSAEDADTLPFTVNVVDGRRWEASGGDAETALSSIPGVAFASSGGAGQTKSLFLRGAKAEHTLVLIDGIPVNDPLSPSRAFDFGQIPVSEIDHIEVLKGPQSVLYGSDAIGGVVQIFTKKSGNRARIEGGSYRTVDANLATMGFRAGYFESRGFSSADVNDGNTESDGYRAWNIGGSKDFPVTDKLLMRLTAQYQDSRADTDKNGGRGGDSVNTYARHSQFLAREENVIFLPSDTELTVAGAYNSHYREDNTNGGDYYNSEFWKGETIARKPLGNHKLTAGAEYADERGKSSQTTGGWRAFRSGGFYLQDQLKISESVDAVGGGRLDLHSETETVQTWRAGLSWWLFPSKLRAKGSIGTGFKVPSLYQSYSSFGSPNLRPERSIGGEAGLEARAGSWRTELTWFTTTFRDQIDFNLVTNRFFNQSRARTNGVEWTLEKDVLPFHASNALTFLHAYDPNSGQLLLRRPRWSDNLTFGFERPKRLGAELVLRYVGEREDSHPILFTRQTMPAFLTLGANFYHELGAGLRLTARGVNLLDRRYQETSGYGVPGLSGYAGVEADL